MTDASRTKPNGLPPTIPWLGKNIRVAVVGDFILDEYLDGCVNRISPEAPVPVHVVGRRSVTAGGAANAARNIQLAGGQVTLFGAVGNDEAATTLLGILEADGITCEQVIRDSQMSTIKKTRITALNQQMMRIDWEQVTPLRDDLAQRLCLEIEAAASDVLLVSDYGKGGLTKSFLRQLFAICHAKGTKIIVDPKGVDYERYRGAHLVTPNRDEACKALGLDPSDNHDPEFLAKELHQRFGVENVLVTLGAQGMLGLKPGQHGEECIALKARAREVYDVSGAGDTVVALMTLGIAAAATLEQAMYIANCGAGVVVEKRGTQPIALAELQQALAHDRNAYDVAQSFVPSTAKIIPRALLDQIIAPPGIRKQQLIFTNGCFDILHAGHVAYLEEAKRQGGTLLVAVNSDDSVRRLKGLSRPVVPLAERLQVLAGLACVDYVVAFSEDTPEALLAEVVPDILIKGADYKPSEVVGAEQVIASGGVVRTITLVDGVSTTNIIEKLNGRGD